MHEAEKRRAYELLRRIHDNNFIISESLRKEIHELFMEDWERELLDNQ